MTRAFSPRSLDEAVEHLARHPDIVPVAGCTDLMVCDPERRDDLRSVLDLTRIPEINGIRNGGDHVEIGATTTFSEIGHSELIRSRYPALADAASVIGGWQIQNRATLGGNMANASPAGDSLPVLLALDARVIAVGPDGRREIDHADFHLGYRRTALRPGEIIAWIRLPHPAPGSVQRFRKVGTREAQAISKVVVAMAAILDGGRLRAVRIAAGSVAATPVRLPRTETLCEGARPDAALAGRAGEAARAEVTPIDDVRSTAFYRRFALGRVVRRIVCSLAPVP